MEPNQIAPTGGDGSGSTLFDQNAAKTDQQMTKQAPFVVVGTLMVTY